MHNDRVSAQGLGRDFERTTRARGCFIEEQCDAFTFKERARLVGIHPTGKVQDFENLRCIEWLDAKQRSVGCIHVVSGESLRFLCGDLLHQQNFFCIINFLKFDFDDFVVSRLHLASDESGLDG